MQRKRAVHIGIQNACRQQLQRALLLPTVLRSFGAVPAQCSGALREARPPLWGMYLQPDKVIPHGVHEGYRKGLTELFCGGQGAAVTKIDPDSMARFPNLEVLWLNDNRITKLKGLQNNFRLKHLFVHNNCIATI